jgi:hypothetical protein
LLLLLRWYEQSVFQRAQRCRCWQYVAGFEMLKPVQADASTFGERFLG